MTFPHINMFDYEVTTVVSTMRDLTVGVFEHLDIKSNLDIDKRIKYTERILIGTAPKK